MYIGNWTIQQQTNSRSVKLRKRSTRGLDDLWNSQLTDSKFFKDHVYSNRALQIFRQTFLASWSVCEITSARFD